VRIWKWIEDRIFPKLRHVVAVNRSVAGLYTAEYGNPITVVRNVPFRKQLTGAADRALLHISPDQKIILYQGAVNVDRGLEEAILAMKYLRSDAVLVIAGVGDIFESLKVFTEENHLSEKVRFLGQVPFQELHAYTLMADLGLSIEKDVSVNYHYCLPNKFLDYIQANIPVLVSPFPEMKALVDQYRIGEFIDSHDPAGIAARIDAMFDDRAKLAEYKRNLLKAAGELCWEAEEGELLKVVSLLENEKP
jgi:glycosyltransferase involved in cell wall biosynthesis